MKTKNLLTSVAKNSVVVRSGLVRKHNNKTQTEFWFYFYFFSKIFMSAYCKLICMFVRLSRYFFCVFFHSI